MSFVSSWSLNPSSRRYVLPQFAVEALAAHALCHELYPQAYGYYEAAAGHAMQRGAAEHSDHLLMYCVQGEGSLEVGAEQVVVRPGALVLLPAGVGHRYMASRERPWSVFFAHFAGDLGSAFMAPLLGERAWSLLPLGVQPQLLADWRALIEASPAGFELLGLVTAANRLRQILTQCAQLAQPVGGHRSRLEVAAVQGYMLSRLSEPPSLAELAAWAGMDRFHFAKTFRKLTGHAPLQHFLHLRMARACLLLDAGEGNIASVANELGYADAHYFSRQFRQVIGLSPSAYRSLKRG